MSSRHRPDYAGRVDSLSQVDAADTTAIITCYNHQSYVEQCLDSLARQTVRPRHIIIVDDESTDDSSNVIDHWLGRADIAADFHRSATNLGLCAVLNRALDLVTTPFFFHISADDWCHPDRVERQAAAIESADEGVAFVAGDFVEVDGGGLVLATHDTGDRLADLTGLSRRAQLHSRLLRGNIIPAPAVTLRTAAVRTVGGYDESLLFEDYDMWLRLTERWGAGYSRGTAAYYRVLATSLSRASDRQLAFIRCEIAILEKHWGEDAEADVTIRERIAALEQLIPIEPVTTDGARSR